MLPCGNYIMALILVLVVWVPDAFIIFTLASQKYMDFLLIGSGEMPIYFLNQVLKFSWLYIENWNIWSVYVCKKCLHSLYLQL